MPIAAIIALVETYGPTAFALAIKYGPTVVSLLKQYGPTLETEVGPLIAASANAGTLEQDVAAIASGLQTLLPDLGAIASLADVAGIIGAIRPVDAGNPEPGQDRLGRPDKKGGR